MNRRIGIALIVVVVLVAYPAAAWLIGITAEHQWEKREQQVTERYPFLEVVKDDYHRGVYSSTEEVTYQAGGQLTQALQAMPGNTRPPGDLQFTVRNIIHHGPLPQLRGFAPAIIDTELVLPADTKQKLVAVFGDKATLSIRTRLHWLGGTTTTVHSSAFEQNEPDGLTFTWRGLDGTTKVGGDFKSVQADFTAPGLTVKGVKGSVNMENFHLQADQEMAFDGLYVGPLELTLAGLEMQQAATGQKVALQKISIHGQSAAQGEYYDMDARLDAGALQVQQFAATQVGYEFRATHLHGPSLSALSKAFRVQQSQNPGGVPDLGKMQEAFKTSGIEILLRDPVIEMPRIGFTMPEGALLVSIKASAHNLTRAELEGSVDELRMALMKHLQASADLRIDTALLDKLLDSSGKGDRITAQLQGLQRQGYLKLEGKALTTHLTYEAGQLKVNNQAFPPLGAMPTPPPGGHP